MWSMFNILKGGVIMEQIKITLEGKESLVRKGIIIEQLVD